jgi:hypothetical protein
MWQIVVGVFLIAHGLVHWVYAAPQPNMPGAEPWSFLTQRWLVTRTGLDQMTALKLGIALISLVTIGFGVSGIGLLTSQDWWRLAAIASSAVSLLLLALFWYKWMIAGPILNTGIILLAIFWGR